MINCADCKYWDKYPKAYRTGICSRIGSHCLDQELGFHADMLFINGQAPSLHTLATFGCVMGEKNGTNT